MHCFQLVINEIEVVRLEPALRAIAIATKGFMPAEEGDALFDAACLAGSTPSGQVFVEIGSYCGRSTVWLGSAARHAGATLYSVDHHRGSEENQAGWEWHDPTLVDESTNLINTLPLFERTIARCGLDDVVQAVVGDSASIGSTWSRPIAFLFIDGGHGTEVARRDYESWVPHVVLGGKLAIHDVFYDPELGGQAPYEQIFLPALRSGDFIEASATGSLRVLMRVSR
ncbi:MAG: class I SAM-dependent methyltransferase [Ilumatobacteraceae bacterium]